MADDQQGSVHLWFVVHVEQYGEIRRVRMGIQCCELHTRYRHCTTLYYTICAEFSTVSQTITYIEPRQLGHCQIGQSLIHYGQTQTQHNFRVSRSLEL